jgi:hypothetical protein
MAHLHRASAFTRSSTILTSRPSALLLWAFLALIDDRLAHQETAEEVKTVLLLSSV